MENRPKDNISSYWKLISIKMCGVVPMLQKFRENKRTQAMAECSRWNLQIVIEKYSIPYRYSIYIDMYKNWANLLAVLILGQSHDSSRRSSFAEIV